MPELSRFHGIIIRMYSDPSAGHHAAHFHAYYGEHAAVYALHGIVLLAGALPLRQQRLVEAWAELHAEELLAAWHLLEQGRRPDSIQPLQ